MLSPIKLNELVDLVCVLFTPVYFSFIQDSVREEDQGKEAALEEDPKEEEKNSLFVRVTIIRNAIYHCHDYVSNSAFILFFSTLVF